MSTLAYTESELSLISKKLSAPEFSHNSWSDCDLNDLRKKIKEYLFSHQNQRCAYCKQEVKSSNGLIWAIDHIIPKEAAPQFMFYEKNLCLACHECNNAKSNKTITKSKAKRIYPSKSSAFTIIHPYFDKYNENILIVKEGFYYVALKPKGETTIMTCRLNRFYEFAGFGSSLDDDERIYMLSQHLWSSNNESLKNSLRKEIAALAIKGSI